MEKYKFEEIKSILALYYSQGAFRGADKRFKEFRKFIIKEAKKRKIDSYELIGFFADHKKELLKLLKKEDYKLSRKVKEKLEEGLIKASIHSLNQKFGIPPIRGQLTIFDNLEDRELIREAKNLNIKVIGWDLTRAEDQAVFAIQKLYSKYGYRGNFNKNDNSLAFTYTEYYEAYGVSKSLYRNKQVFSQAEKNQAFESLLSLKKKECIIAYNQLDLVATKKKKRQIFNRIETLESIIPKISFLYIGVDGKEIEKLESGGDKTNKLKAIKIIPSEILLDQIGNYYALLPSNLYLELKEKLPNIKNRHLPMFIQWLAKEIALGERRNFAKTYVISFEKLSYILRMETWIKANRKKMIDNRLMECFKQAKVLGYLKDFKITKGKTVSKKVNLYINVNKFKPQKQTEEIIYNSNFEEVQEIKILSSGEKVEDSEKLRKAREKLKTIRGF